MEHFTNPTSEAAIEAEVAAHDATVARDEASEASKAHALARDAYRAAKASGEPWHTVVAAHQRWVDAAMRSLDAAAVAHEAALDDAAVAVPGADSGECPAPHFRIHSGVCDRLLTAFPNPDDDKNDKERAVSHYRRSVFVDQAISDALDRLEGADHAINHRKGGV